MKGFTFDLQRFDDTVTKENAVAQITTTDGTTYYATLEAAFTAVKSGETITLLKNSSGNGIKVPENSKFTVDFGGNTYTIDGTTVGSTGTETNGFQLLKNSTITFKNGIITSSKAKILIQNYSNLTLEGITLDGSKLDGSRRYTLSNNNGNVTIKDTTINAKSDGFAFDVCVYASYPKVNVTVTGNSVINGNVEMSKSDSRNYSDATLTIDGGTFKGELSIPSDAATGDNKATIKINGGKFAVANETLGITAEVVDTEGSYFTTENLADSIEGVTKITIDGTTKYYTTQELADAATKNCIAKIDGTTSYYTTLQAAVNAVQDNGIITLLKDATGGGIATYTDLSGHKEYAKAKNFTIDFGGHIYTIGSPTVGSTGYETQAFHLEAGSDTSNPVSVKFKNGTITSSVAKMLVQNYSNLTLENMTLDGSKLVGDAPYTYTLSNNNGTVNITNSTIKAKDGGYAFDLYVFQSYPKVNVTVENSTINGKVELARSNKATHQGYSTLSLTINSGTFNGDLTGVADALKQVKINGGNFANSAITATAKLLVVDNVLVAKGWNKTADKTFAYVAASESSGNVGTKLITVGGIDSADQLKFDETNKIFAVPKDATTSDLATGYKTVKVAYDANSTTATVSTTEDAIEITENLLADTVTKISASGNANTVYISGGDKVNSIVGGSKDDTLAGSNENISLTGGDGSDIFVAGKKITITDYGVGSDKISVAADAGTPTVEVSGKNNLVLTFDGGKTVNLLGAADEVITITDGEKVSYYSKDGETSDKGDSVTLPASTPKYTVKAPIVNVDGSKTSGVVITGDKSDNSLIGSAGNDKLLGNAGDDTLSGGAGGKDTFTGGKGNDVFVYEAGNAIITDYSASGSNGADKISVDGSPTSFKFSGSNLVLNFNDGKDTLTLIGAKNKALTFIDGENKTVRTYIDNGAVSEDGKITLDENFKGSGQNISKVNDVMQIDATASARNLNLVGNNKGNTLTGGKGNDSLTGGTGNDSLTGGTGNDSLTGGDGADVFIYGGGTDTVTDYKSAGDDTVKLNKGYSIKSAAFGEDVDFTFSNGNTLKLTGAADKSVTVKDASNKVWTYTDQYTAHGDGVTLQASANEFAASGNAWKNLVTLDGSAATEGVKLTGNAKNNVFVGSEGADTFVYTAGNDTITNLDSSDTVQVGDFSSITAAKFGTKTVVTVGKGSLTFKGNPTSINLVDTDKNTATLTNAGIVTEGGIQLFNGTKTYDGDASAVDASNVKNNITLAGGSKAQTFTGAPGKTVYTYSGKETMTIENYAAGDKISVKGSVEGFTVADNNVTLTIDGGGSIVIKGAASKVITLHDNADKSGKFTARAYLQTGVIADKAITAVTLDSSVTEYKAPSTVKQITYKGGEVTISNFNTTKGKINHDKLAITDVSENSLAFGTGNTLTLADHAASDKVQLAYTNGKGKTVNSTVYLGEDALYNNIADKATAVSVTGGNDNAFTAVNKIKTVTALGDTAISITGNALNNTLTANNAGDTLDGGAGTDVLIGGSGADIFIHDKTTGTTTINGYSTGDSISLGDELSIVGSAYSPGKKNGSLTLTVANSDNASTSKIVINSTDFTKAKGTTSGTVTINNTSTSYGKNAIYSDDEVKLLPTYSGKFTASAGAQVDGSAVKKSLTLQGTTGNETLTGGAFKTTLTGGKGDDSLIGGSGADVFTYSKGDGEDVIADFTYNKDKLKITKSKLISGISVDDKNLKFTMNGGGSVTIEDVQDNFFIKANSTLYWFDNDNLVTASDKATKNKLSAIIKAPTDYAIVELDYGTNLVSAKLATASNQSATFSADIFKKTT